jgi:uncharacterized protein YbbC (DUF1343 family)
MKLIRLMTTLLVFCVSAYSFNESVVTNQVRAKTAKIITGAEQTDKYLPYLKGKRVALLANQTTITGGGKHVVDFLMSQCVRSRTRLSRQQERRR